VTALQLQTVELHGTRTHEDRLDRALNKELGAEVGEMARSESGPAPFTVVPGDYPYNEEGTCTVR
jgi:hypothetical protein